MKYDTETLKEIITMQPDEERYSYAQLLLSVKCPEAEKKITRLGNKLAKVLKEVRKEFPEACYYTSGGDGFALILGATHTNDTANDELCAFIVPDLTVGGGDGFPCEDCIFGPYPESATKDPREPEENEND